MPDPGLAALGLVRLREMMESGEITSRDAVEACIAAHEADERQETPVNGFVDVYDDALERADEADRRRRSGGDEPLLGLPVAVKDNIHYQGHTLTCASRILSDYRAPYTATVLQRLLDAGAVPVGRTNMDEFAMGSSCEYTIYGPTHNPVARDRTAGGSSGGSAAVVAAGQAPFALGSDTGGSVRLPASYCGVYGFKPSYGTLSRYGLVAFGSSLDQIGFLSGSPEDAALVLSVCGGADPRDATTHGTNFRSAFPLPERGLRGTKVGIPEQLVGDGVESSVMSVFGDFVSWLEDAGAEVERFSLPILDAGIAIYYIIAPAEASSNLSRYDGVKYGYRVDAPENLLDMYERTRDRGFGAEVKRRILIGNYVLSSGYYDAYYKKAQAVRALLIRELDRVMTEYDIVVSPTSPVLPFRLGEKVDDPLNMYMTDMCTTFVSLAYLPSVSVPVGAGAGGLPVGVQLTAARFAEERLLQAAQLWHTEGGDA